MWNAEDEMIVADGQRFLLPLPKPLVARIAMTAEGRGAAARTKTGTRFALKDALPLRCSDR
jgi:hypothetical protein